MTRFTPEQIEKLQEAQRRLEQTARQYEYLERRINQMQKAAERQEKRRQSLAEKLFWFLRGDNK